MPILTSTRGRPHRVRSLAWVAAAVLSLPSVAAGQGPSLSELTREDQEVFLQQATILSREQIGIGVTLAERATLMLGDLTHDAQVQCVDVFKPEFKSHGRTEFNFRDSYRYNIAAYRLDELLDLGMLPVSVKRKVRGKHCAVTWWIDDVQMDEKARHEGNLRAPDARAFAVQRSLITAFDQLIYNTDRNQQNLLITTDWRLWMIDHTRAFRTYDELQDPKDLEWCDRVLLERLRRLDEPTLRSALGEALTRWEIEGLAARAARLVSHFDRRVAAVGERYVLFDWLRP